ncbi:glycosyltransferase [Glutamicibacter arilaitensis]|uniref:glycosyltransferase n=1 Tax=Glutamicibacter arilaitensis TaxID=256701 RepID=UPI003F904F93
MDSTQQHLNAYMVTWRLEREFGGMTTVCIQRAAAFAERYGSAAVVTFPPSPQLDQIAAELVQRGKLSPKVQVLNPYAFLAEHELDPQASIPEPASEPEHQDFTCTEQVYLPGDNGTLFCEHSTTGPDEQITRMTYYRGDGTVFLTDTSFEDTKPRRIVEAFDRSGILVARFPSAAAFYRHWLTQIVDHPDSLVVVDSKFTAKLLASWTPVHVPKIFAFHSIHVAKGQDLASGHLSKGHGPIIAERSTWDGFVFLTRAQRKAYVDRFGETDSTFVIPNPLNAPAAQPPVPQRSPLNLIAAGSLTPNKNVAAALEVIAELVRRGKQPTLHIVGEGNQSEALVQKVDELELGAHVVFHGYSDQLPRHFASCTAQLFTSTNEGQALVILEAQAQGCIPVSFDINFGPSDSIIDGHNGFLVPHGDIQAMADRVQSLMDDPTLAAELSENARTFASEYQSRDLVSRWEETLSLTKMLKNLGAKNRVPHFEAKLRGVDFLDGQRLHVRVEHQAQLEDLPEPAIFELVFINRRSTEEIASVAASSVDEQLAAFDLEPSLLGETQEQDAAVDMNLRLRVGKAMELKRLGLPESKILPYFTTHKNLSFNRRG